MNLFKLACNVSVFSLPMRKIFNVQRFYFSETLEKFTDMFDRKAADEQNRKYSSGFAKFELFPKETIFLQEGPGKLKS